MAVAVGASSPSGLRGWDPLGGVSTTLPSPPQTARGPLYRDLWIHVGERREEKRMWCVVERHYSDVFDFCVVCVPDSVQRRLLEHVVLM